MRIKHIHIDNFGRLSDFDYDFRDGLNLICQENGWGKTTLATFIYAMLYGFPSKGTAKDETVNDRLHYKPWNGGTYGGSLTFDDGRKTYTVYRTFGEKRTGSDDSFQLIDLATRKESRDYSRNLGAELFGINDLSYLNTAMIRQDDSLYTASSEITSKVTNQPAALADIGSYDRVQKQLTDRLNRLSGRKASGLQSKLQGRILELEEQIRRGPLLDAAIERLEERKAGEKECYEETQQEQKMVSNQQKLYGEYQEAIALKAQYQELLDNMGQRRSVYDLARGYFPGPLPSVDALDDLLTRTVSLGKEEMHVAGGTLTVAEGTELEGLSELFAEGCPEEKDLAGLLELNRDLKKKSRELAGYRLTVEEREQLAVLERRFAEYLPAEEELSEAIKTWNAGIRAGQDADSILGGIQAGRIRQESLEASRRDEVERQIRKLEEESGYLELAATQKRNALEGKVQLQEMQRISLDGELKNLDRDTEQGGVNPLAIVLLAAGLVMAVLPWVGSIVPESARMMVMLLGLLAAVGGLAAGLLGLNGRKAREAAREEERNRICRELEQGREEILRIRADIEGTSRNVELEKAERARKARLLRESVGQVSGDEVLNQQELDGLQKKLEDTRAAAAEHKEKVKRLFMQLHITFDEKLVLDDLQELVQDVRTYGRLMTKIRMGSDNSEGRAIQLLQDQIREVLDLFTRTEDSDDYEGLIYQLQNQTRRYRILMQKRQDHRLASRQAEKLRREIVSELGGLGFAAEEDLHGQVIAIQNHLTACTTARNEYGSAKKKVERFEREHPMVTSSSLSQIPAEIAGVSSMEELTRRLQSLTGQLTATHEQIVDYQKQIDQKLDERAEITRKEEELDSLHARKEELRREEWLLTTTRSLMERARDSYAARYMDPIQSAFNHYYSMLDVEEKEQFVIDSDYNISVKGGSTLHKIGILSRGYQNLADICMRFALLDAMYEKEKPLVILDDPFVNLDDGKYERAMDFLHKVSGDYQTLYFTCTERGLHQGRC